MGYANEEMVIFNSVPTVLTMFWIKLIHRIPTISLIALSPNQICV